MNGPDRLIDDDPLLAKLVADAKQRGPRPEALEALLRRLPPAPTSSSLAPTGAGLAKWLLLAGAGCFIAGVTIFELRQSEPATAVDVLGPSEPAAAPSAEGAVPSSDEVQGSAIPSASVDDLPAARSRSAAAQPSAVKLSLRREIDLIGAAREALTKDEAHECLAAVRAYEREFPSGQFLVEAKVMRIEATAMSGERGRARTLARDFLAKNPRSPYDARMRSLLDSLEDR